jgi:hypothetical protein
MAKVLGEADIAEHYARLAARAATDLMVDVTVGQSCWDFSEVSDGEVQSNGRLLQRRAELV